MRRIVILVLLAVVSCGITPALADRWALLPGRELVDVQTAAPQVVVLVLRDHDGNPPPAQDTSQYRVNGQTPRKVGRFSAPSYEEKCVDWNAQRYPLIVMHRLYLVLDAPLEEGRAYEIAYPGGQTRFTFRTSTTLCESIKVNQVGYGLRTHDHRAFFAAWLGDLGGVAAPQAAPFEVHDRSTGQVALRGKLQPAIEDAGVGGPACVIDLSPLRREGEYRLVIPGVGRSHDFGVGDRYAHHVFYVHMKGFYHQRCGVALTQPFTQWTRPACHTTMAVTEADPPDFIKQTGPTTRPSSGGHHDAGDFDHRLAHTLVPGWLLDAYELEPGRFTDGQLDIPEGGNGIPDLLDEALFALRRWEVLQEDDGGIRAGVEADRHPTYGEVNAATDKLVYRTFRRYGHTTLAGAGLFAYAARLVEPFDKPRSAALLNRAQRAWRFYETHRDDRAYQFSPGARLLASGQLYLATGAERYHQEFLAQARHFCDLDGKSKWPAQYAGMYYNLQTVDGGMAFTHYFASYLLDQSRPKDADVTAALRRAVITKADAALRTLSERSWGYFSTRSWGESTGVGRWGDYLVHAHKLTGRQEYLDAAGRAADYVLGANPSGWCFTSGLGQRPPYNPLHLDSYYHIEQGRGPAPGLVIYGLADPGRAPYVRAVAVHVYPSLLEGKLPALRAITDGWSVVAQNEFTTWETMAPNTFLHAALAPDKPLRGAVLPLGPVVIPGGYPVRAGASTRPR